MIDLNEYRENRLRELRERLEEINEIVGLEAAIEQQDRHDLFAMRLKEKRVRLMKAHFDEMASIKIEIARLEGRKSIFEEEYI